MRTLASVLFAAVTVVSGVAQADDTEIYTLTSAATTGGADTNIIFMLDNSGSMKDPMTKCSGLSGGALTTCTADANSRIFTLRKVMAEVLSKLDKKTKVALFSYGNQGGTGASTVLAPLQPLETVLADGTTQLDFLLDWFVAAGKVGDAKYAAANEPPNWKYDYNSSETTMKPINSTPLVPAFAEIGLYLKGLPASSYGKTKLAKEGILSEANAPCLLWGSNWGGTYCVTFGPIPTRNYGVKAVDAGGKYISPVTSANTTASCNKPSWHIILLTDGDPSDSSGMTDYTSLLADVDTTSASQSPVGAPRSRLLTGTAASVSGDGYDCDPSTGGSSNWACMVQGAKYLKNGVDTVPLLAGTNPTYGWGNCAPDSRKTSCGSSTPTNTCNAGATLGTTVKKAYTKGGKSYTDTWTCIMTAAGTASTPAGKIQYDNLLGIDVNTHTIYLGPDSKDASGNLTGAAQNLSRVATAGGGQFYTPTSVDALLAGLSSIVKQATSNSSTIASPGVAVNQMNRFQHLDQLYYSVFLPSSKKTWSGNLKRYWLKNTQLDGSGTDFLADATGLPAISMTGTTAGFFSKDAQSCWGDSSGPKPAGCEGSFPDGFNVGLGGSANRADAAGIANRNVLTITSTVAPAPTATTTSSSSLVSLSSSAFLATAANQATVAGYFGLPGTTTLTELNGLVAWARGITDPAGVPLAFNDWMGDPLHAQPVLVNYGFTGTFAASQADATLQKNYLFISTNSGYLHGVDAKNGNEQFAFIPRELLPILPKAKKLEDWVTGESRLYGLDATWTPWRRDTNADNQINVADGDWVYLYGGMRMGGSNIYALDVTTPTTPTLKWVINGAVGGGFQSDINGNYSANMVAAAFMPSATSPYRFMGQSWSQPVLTRIPWGAASGADGTRTALIFGGGYDPRAETSKLANGTFPSNTFGKHTYGHQLYIVDAKSGALLFWATGATASSDAGATEIAPTLRITGMDYGVTGSPVPVDRDGDGITDLIYYADLGGQVWRLDLRNKNTNNGTANSCSGDPVNGCANLVLGSRKVASLGEAQTPSDITKQRRFFESPGVAIMQRPGASTQYIGLALDSGNRSHPRFIGTQEKAYMLEDRTALTLDLASTYATHTTLTDSTLQDVTTFSYTAGSLNAFSGMSGFSINLDNTKGEKGFSTPLIFQGNVYLTSYIPDNNTVITATTCTPQNGNSSLYVFSAFDGRSTKANAASLLDRSSSATSSITGDPQLLFRPGGKTTVVTGTNVQKGEDLVGKGVRRTRWYEKSK